MHKYRFNNDRYSDIELKFNDGKSFSAHRAILYFGSEYFQKMLDINMEESFSEVIVIQENFEDFENILKCIYGIDWYKTIKWYSSELFHILDKQLYMIDKYCMSNMKLTIQAQIKNNIDGNIDKIESILLALIKHEMWNMVIHILCRNNYNYCYKIGIAFITKLVQNELISLNQLEQVLQKLLII